MADISSPVKRLLTLEARVALGAAQERDEERREHHLRPQPFNPAKVSFDERMILLDRSLAAPRKSPCPPAPGYSLNGLNIRNGNRVVSAPKAHAMSAEKWKKKRDRREYMRLYQANRRAEGRAR